VGEIKVTIYERVKLGNDWTRVRVEVPKGRRRDGRLLLKDERQGEFQLSRYEKRGKKFQNVTNPNDDSLRFGFSSVWITDYKKGLLYRIPESQLLSGD